MSEPRTHEGEPQAPGAVEQLARDDVARKRFLTMAGKRLGAGAAATARGSFIAACGSSSSSSSSSAAGTSSASPAAATSSAAASSPDLGIAKAFGEEESEHVSALIAAINKLGGKPVKKPTFAFPVTNQKSFLKLAYVLENTSVGAYNGAGPSLISKALLAAAGSIVQVEARHAATIGLLTNMSLTPNGAFDKPLSTKQVLGKAGPLIKM